MVDLGVECGQELVISICILNESDGCTNDQMDLERLHILIITKFGSIYSVFWIFKDYRASE